MSSVNTAADLQSTETFHWCYLYILARNLELIMAKLMSSVNTATDLQSTETFHWGYVYILARNLELIMAKIYMSQHTILREQSVTVMKTNNKTSEMRVVLFLSHFNQNRNVSTNFSENPSINFKKFV
jgi:hypothetical protein